ncbi:MAG: hypothetical protein ACTH5V_13870 [Serratia proteamaculans]
MRVFRGTLLVSIALASFSSSAEWLNKSEDDIFTGGKTSTLIVTLGNYDVGQGFIFDCSKDNLTFSYVEKSKDLSKAAVQVDMIVKVDSGVIIKTKGSTGVRNDEYSKIETDDRDNILEILKAARNGKSKMVVGLSVPEINVRQSYTANMSGSTKAINDFATSCGIDLK